ncbi:hypothetical protein COY25_00860 [Candidatus Uhrbacteria bacterium CG_4_10_14_0_2_um_filter_41_7]|uniref:Uncharacterized protein n=1 Tax=Candidatus Uhrbacteria bacterium CG_4_9_14_3_um_filter_41_35 TaxID=1975034 RepID=A0A2M7XF11_9BACT|nr:MAG: hypothetical protein COV92_03210 [Candidatus Uhrbacteria bacterium CG11_big_fil_rev_8_21_14_0_20_41_9]PIZ55530.1 MAG: hypothetical protein COY25_00860 [Candidatus Uhrbacteria bacterium CG_4_10_14_0_2_um_filter_41_7]PJA46461.1 MAG: hypothetical protein CO173_01705 [Candidatus Uhrbacteria bacterium CG_4_9_14_3_um_filter_41_35]
MKFVLTLVLLLLFTGVGCSNATNAINVSSNTNKISATATYEAPTDWGTWLDTQHGFTFHYPPEYTADLDFETMNIIVSRNDDGTKLISVSNSYTKPTFTKLTDNVPFFNEIVDSATFKQ